jgi:hypothetical protein
VVVLRIEGEDLIVWLTHCKSTIGDAGARLSDLYEVCGQAQKSIRWRRNPTPMLRHLIRRERRRLERYGRKDSSTATATLCIGWTRTLR